MATDLFLATSGFALPVTDLYHPFEVEDEIGKLIFSRSMVSSNDTLIREFYKKTDVYCSETANVALDKYMTDPSFENFIRLVDIALDVVDSYSFFDFVMVQAMNKYVSNLGFRLCEDLVTGRFKTNYQDYNLIPSAMRPDTSESMTRAELEKRAKRVSNKAIWTRDSWTTLFSELMTEEAAFVSFYKFVFADYY